MVNVYVSEIYSTKVRDFALGLVQGCGYLGSFIAQYLFVYLNDLSVYYCPILFFCMCTLNGIFCCLLKVETMGKPLDIHTDIEERFSGSKNNMKNQLNIELGNYKS